MTLRRVRQIVFVAMLGFVLTVVESRHNASAHPLSQGRIQIDILGQKIKLALTVAAEEVIVEQTLRSADDDTYTLPPDACGKHGGYLLEHLVVRADGIVLVGKVTRSEAPPEGPIHVLNIAGTWATYELEYEASAPPRDIAVTQNVLNEKNYAPGNRWEVAYITTARRDGATLFENRLLDSGTPLKFDVGTIDSQRKPADAEGTKPPEAPLRETPAQQHGKSFPVAFFLILLGFFLLRKRTSRN